MHVTNKPGLVPSLVPCDPCLCICVIQLGDLASIATQRRFFAHDRCTALHGPGTFEIGPCD
jgi:hypothetical protein